MTNVIRGEDIERPLPPLPDDEPDIGKALRQVLNLVIHHQLTHQYDADDLSTAIELLKAIRDDPTEIPVLQGRWAEDIKAAHIP